MKVSEAQEFHGHANSITSVSFSEEKLGLLASASSDHLVKVWALRSQSRGSKGPPAPVELRHAAGVNDVCWSSQNPAHLVSAVDDNTLSLFDVSRPAAPLSTFGSHDGAVICVAYHPKQDIIASTSIDKTTRVWDVRSQTCVQTFNVHSDIVTGCVFHKSGSFLASCSYDGKVNLMDTAKGELLKTVVEDELPKTTVRFSPNGKFLLVSSLGGPIRLWKHATATAKPTREYSGHVNDNVYVANGFLTFKKQHFVVSGSEDGNVRVWDLQKKTLTETFGGHEGTISAVAICGSRIATGGFDKAVKLWNINP